MSCLILKSTYPDLGNEFLLTVDSTLNPINVPKDYEPEEI